MVSSARQLFSISKAAFFSIAVLGAVFAPTGFSQAKTPEVTVRDASYKARFISQSIADPIEIPAGESKTVLFQFKNTGTAAWDASSARFISGYTMEPRSHASALAGSNWLNSHQTAKISGVIRPGQTGKMEITLTAPKKLGDYEEHFFLAAENHTWIEGGYFFVKVRSVASSSVSEKKIDLPTGLSAAPKTGEVGAVLAKQTVKKVAVRGGEPIQMITMHKNTGVSPWQGYALLANQPSALAEADGLSFGDASWRSGGIVLEKEKIVESGKYIREDFVFRAPSKAGTYTAVFRLAIAGTAIPGADAIVEIEVTEDASDDFISPFQISEEETPRVAAPRLSTEPRIRVGLWKNPEESVQFRSDEEDYRLLIGESEIGLVERRTLITMHLVGSEYIITGFGETPIQTSQFVRLEPVSNPRAVFTLVNRDRTVSWKGDRNFNRYRGAMELRKTDDGNESIYVINELLFEDYVRGIGENSNAAPEEYLKAQTVAQRSYAYYIQNSTGKHDDRHFDVVAHTGDQLYLGVVSEEMLPRFVAAAEATRGYMATYDNAVVITPYYGNSNGATKSWQEVWGGKPKPWLVPVKAEYDIGRRMNGHGVGMAQLDAAARADKEGLTWDALIKYYYTGVGVEKMYF